MIYLDPGKLVILSQPKTGTVALTQAIKRRGAGGIMFVNPPRMKHIRYDAFLRHVAPMLADVGRLNREDYLVVAVMREPLDWVGSWYRFRTRDFLKNANDSRSSLYTGDMSFESFVRDYCRPKDVKLRHASVGNACQVAMAAPRVVGVDLLFPYEDMSGLHQLIESRAGLVLEMQQANVSPKLPLDLSDEARALLRATCAFEIELHASLRPDGQIDPRFRDAGASRPLSFLPCGPDYSARPIRL
jgi:hypothetical protein